MKAHILAFFATVIWHIVYIYVVKAIARNKAQLATTMNMFAWIIYAKITIDYIGDNWLLLSSTIGAGVGTFITMKYFSDVKDERIKEDPDPKTIKDKESIIKKDDKLMEKINLNRADAKELQKIIHIGPKRADKIISRRPYKDIYELSNVLGLGSSRMKEIFEQGIIEV